MKTSAYMYLAAATLTSAITTPVLAQGGPPPGYGAAPGYGQQGGYAPQGGQGGYAQQGGGQGIPVQQMMEKLRKRYGRLDVNHDNRISLAEWSARKSKKGGAQQKDPSRSFNKVDTNHDGYVSVAELNAFVERKVRKMDRNGDGLITPDEKHHGGKHGGGGHGGHQGDDGDSQY